MWRTIVIVFAMTGLGPYSAHAQNAQFQIEPDAAIQRRIGVVAFRPLTDLSKGSFADDLAALLRNADVSKQEFTAQITYYAYHMEERVLVPAVYRLLALAEVSQHDCATVLSKYLYSDDRKLREQVRELFPFAVSRDLRDGCYPDYSGLNHLVRERLADPVIAVPLTRMMFETSPAAAFLFFHTEAGRDMIAYRRFERIVSNAIYEKRHLGGIAGGQADATTMDALRELAKSKYWWSRLFVAEIMVQNKECRDLALVEKLTKDDHELVRKSAVSLNQNDSMRASEVEH